MHCSLFFITAVCVSHIFGTFVTLGKNVYYYSPCALFIVTHFFHESLLAFSHLCIWKTFKATFLVVCNFILLNMFRWSISSGVSQWLYIHYNLLSEHLRISGQRIGIRTRVQLLWVRILLGIHDIELQSDFESCIVIVLFVGNAKIAHWQRENNHWCACWISLRLSSMIWTATVSSFVLVTMATTSQWCWMMTTSLKNTVRTGRHVKGGSLVEIHYWYVLRVRCSTSAGSV